MLQFNLEIKLQKLRTVESEWVDPIQKSSLYTDANRSMLFNYKLPCFINIFTRESLVKTLEKHRSLSILHNAKKLQCFSNIFTRESLVKILEKHGNSSFHCYAYKKIFHFVPIFYKGIPCKNVGEAQKFIHSQ